MKQEPMQRFLEKVDKGSRPPCWEWTGYCDKAGYGYFDRKLAHRWLYLRTKGPIPSGLALDHACDNKRCVNPDHLRPMTLGLNVLRSPKTTSGANIRKEHCPKGHPLSDDNVYYTKRERHRRCKECNRRNASYHYHKKAGHVVTPTSGEWVVPGQREATALELLHAWAERFDVGYLYRRATHPQDRDIYSRIARLVGVQCE